MPVNPERLHYLLVKFLVNPDTSARSEVALTHESNDWTDDQKVKNTISVLELIRTLTSPNSPSTLVNQNVLNQTKILFNITNLAMTGRIPALVRGHALLAVGDIIRGNQVGQKSFLEIVLPSSPGQRPVVLAMIETSLSKDEFVVRSGSTYVIQVSFL